MRKAMAIWSEYGLIDQFRRNGMRADFSWSRFTTQYIEMYEELMGA
jgi:glycogen synthase